MDVITDIFSFYLVRQRDGTLQAFMARRCLLSNASRTGGLFGWEARSGQNYAHRLVPQVSNGPLTRMTYHSCGAF